MDMGFAAIYYINILFTATVDIITMGIFLQSIAK